MEKKGKKHPNLLDTHATQRNGVNLGPAAIHFVLTGDTDKY